MLEAVYTALRLVREFGPRVALNIARHNGDQEVIRILERNSIEVRK